MGGDVLRQAESPLGHTAGDRSDGIAVAADAHRVADRVLVARRFQRADQRLGYRQVAASEWR